jgi:L-amino acid N-acyltransferase YncA
MPVHPMTVEHAAQVLAIYQAGIDEGNATFEELAPSWAEFDSTKLASHRFVVEDGGQVLGWVAASRISSRSAYAGVVEHSVYVHPDARGQGVGKRLLTAVIDSTESDGIWTIQSGIFPENIASIRLHHSMGFRTVGTRERIGRHHGRWRDVEFLERRSPSPALE